jgi:hypothetical protein
MLAAAPSKDSSTSSRPEETDAERLLSAHINKESEGRAKLASFKKTDGQSAQVMGVAVYLLAFESTIEFTKDCKWLRELFGGGRLAFKTREAPPVVNGQGFSWDDWLEKSQHPGIVVKKGATAGVAGTLRFEKSERGWSLSNVEGKVVSEPLQSDGNDDRRGTAVITATSAGNVATSKPSGYPISSNSNLWTKFGIDNDTLRSIDIFLDSGDAPIAIRGGRTYTDKLEVGSTHLLKAVVGSRTFEVRFTVPRVMRDVHITAAGIDIQ